MRVVGYLKTFQQSLKAGKISCGGVGTFNINTHWSLFTFNRFISFEGGGGHSYSMVFDKDTLAAASIYRFICVHNSSFLAVIWFLFSNKNNISDAETKETPKESE